MAESARKGYLSGSSLAGLFAWLRPNDMVWGYWVNNYLLGQDPPAWDILYWNSRPDQHARRPAPRLRADGARELAGTPGAMDALGGPVDLSQITADSYVVAGIADHISPWENAYRTTQLLGSEPRFVLSTSGHVVAMVNPPGDDKANYKVNASNPPEGRELAAGRDHPGGLVVAGLDGMAGRALGRRGRRARPRPARGPTTRCSDEAPGEIREGRGLRQLPRTGGVYYERRGQGEPLLLISGFAISGAVFEPVLAPYEERFECILYDHRGAGRSRTPLRPISIPELAADAVRVLDELGLESAHVMGVSMGGMVAQEMAIRFPHRVRGLVLGCTTPGGPRACGRRSASWLAWRWARFRLCASRAGPGWPPHCSPSAFAASSPSGCASS